MLENEVKANGTQSTNGMPMDLRVQEGQEPTEVMLAMLFTAAKVLESRGLCQVLTGISPLNKKIVTYIKMPMVEVDAVMGFKIVESIGNEVADAK